MVEDGRLSSELRRDRTVSVDYVDIATMIDATMAKAGFNLARRKFNIFDIKFYEEIGTAIMIEIRSLAIFGRDFATRSSGHDDFIAMSSFCSVAGAVADVP